MRKRLQSSLLAALLVLAALFAWELAARLDVINTRLMPSPTQVAGALRHMVFAGDLLLPVWHTLKLLLTSLALATLIGAGVGLAMGMSRTLFNLLEPLVELIRPVPKPALIPPLFLFFGIGWTSMLVIVTVGATFPILTNTLAGVRGVDPVLLGTARTFRTRAKLRSVVLPATLPAIFTGLKVSVGIAVVLCAIAEVLAGQGGVGSRIVEEQRAFVVDRMYAWVVVLSAIGVGLMALVTQAEKVLVPWRGKA